MNVENSWTVYRTRFLVQACQIQKSLAFTDALGREHFGQPGDYLVVSSDGLRRITPRQLFEDIYVPLPSTSITSISDQDSVGKWGLARGLSEPAANG